MVAFFIQTLFKMSISVQFRIGNKNYWNELHILSTVPLASLARSGFISYQGLLYFLPGNYRGSDSLDSKLYFVCWTMRIRMHRMRVRKMGIEDYSLACRSVSIHSLSSIGEVWRIISWKFKKKKANGMIESELGLTLHLCKKIRRGHTLLS